MTEAQLPDTPSRIEEDLRRLEGKASEYGDAYYRWRKLYEQLTYVLGLPAVISAGAATVAALNEVSPTIVASLAAAASVLTAIQVFVRPADQAALNRSQWVEFRQLASEIELIRKYKLALLSHAEAVAEMERLAKAFFALERRALRPRE